MVQESPICNSPIIVVLGASNSNDGKLSPIAESRIEKAIELMFEKEEAILLLAGGYGSFNSALRPHAAYLKDYALSRGIPEHRILLCPLSTNTVEDAVYAKDLLDILEHEGEITVISSDHHKQRAETIFSSVFSNRHIRVVGTSTETPTVEIEVIVTPEVKTLQQVSNQGGVRSGIEEIKST